MKAEPSPYRKLNNMAPLHFRGIPRRRRVLVYALLLFCLIWFMPSLEANLGKTLLFFISPNLAGPYQGKGSSVDVLKYIDPLIGTTNGGMLTHSPHPSQYSLRLTV